MRIEDLSQNLQDLINNSIQQDEARKKLEPSKINARNMLITYAKLSTYSISYDEFLKLSASIDIAKYGIK